ncbi:UDP-arabinose 4-epimerase [Desulfacinum infernum DSM 9756]|uniref:UDP-glucose 4-epimerase n=1 Tax=Desulfacinum infernum DSM 9756 TaxID=1121391 RepID=A0A1M5EPX0_9BACT|nr:UDP-glucose 4-epimerase GalE [Desulfacinum infernum]SHF81285.1 UDP-arabinose 4-epimerase [Desulfacinum infernum DSM 9756]
MNVLVTGGAGYIGSHTAKLIKGRGHTPVVFDNLSNGWAEWARFGPFVFGDIRDEEALFRTLQAFRIDAVIHFAALASVEESTRRPGLYFDNNVGGTIALVQAMARAGVRRLVFSSSAAVYGKARTRPIREDHPREPTNPYGLSKWQCEQVVETVAAAEGIHFAALRYFNVVGNDPDGELYERHEPETHVLPNLLRAARSGEPFFLFGTDHDTPDGTAVRDYVYVMDLAEAHLKALDVIRNQPRLVSNVGRGRGVSVREMVRAVEEVLNVRVNVQERPIRAGDPPELVADNTFLRTWFPREFKELPDVIREMAGRPPYA